jgi:protein involved in polysaccharide export with SLBB domain
MRAVNLFVMLSVAVTFFACSAHKINKGPSSSSAKALQPPLAYLIRPGDELDIKFFYNPELNEKVTVRPDGKISLLLVDEIQAAGVEPKDLDKLLTKKYSRKLKTPEIAVIVKSFTGQRIYVGGEVNNQCEMALPAGMTVLQAVLQAGGFKETANPENAILIRQGSNNEPVPIKIDLENAIYGQGEGSGMTLLPNDIIYIPKSAIAEANKFVRQYIENLIMFRGFSAGLTYQINENAE